ncbi:MAG: non-ribosomal peptide synthetase, partial [Terriglobales bacterium]
RRVQATVWDAMEHEELPFAEVVQAHQTRMDRSRSPLFQVIFSQQPEAPKLAQGWELSTEEIANGGSKMDLVFVVDDRGDGIGGPITYNPDLFESATMARLVGHYRTLLQAIGTTPEQPVAGLPLLTEAEQAQYQAWNATERDYPAACVPALIEQQAARTPTRVAVRCEGRELTYQELNTRANRVAARLRERGVKSNTLVGVSMERSLEMVVALLGIWKSGGAYVPLDPDYPAERLAFLLEDAGVALLLSESALVQRWPRHRCPLLCLDKLEETLEGAAALASSARMQDAAYVMYTSGSTGEPKGVIITHRSISNRLLWMQDQYGLQEQDVVVQKTPFSFDVSVWELFWPLMNGARLVLAKPGGHREPAYLAQLITAEQVSIVHFVPSMLDIFLDTPQAGACRTLREVICSGEALPYALQEKFFRTLPARLHNLYGPTEAAVDVTAWECRRGDARRLVPIGRPVANTHIHILDRHRQPVPVGVAGELYIGGVQVGQGYHRRPELTAAKFIDDPSDPQTAGRLYRTGDRCRWLGDGALEYLGRLDSQVKLHGCRIELGEIEGALRRHAAVHDAVVVRDGEREPRLIAYVVWANGEAGSAAGLRSFLEEKLPGYMIPAAWVVLPALPLSANGKLDRKRLPAPESSLGKSAEYEPPRGEREIRLAALWAELLQLDGVGRNDNFFDLGGRSLLAITLIERVRLDLGKRAPASLSLVTLLQAPTVRELAAVLAHAPGSGQVPGIVAWHRAGTRPPLFWMGATPIYRPLAERLGREQPFLGVHPAPAAIGKLGVPYRLEEYAACLIPSLRAVQPEGPYYLGGFCRNAIVAYEVAAQLAKQGQKVGLVVLFDAPVFRAGLPGWRWRILLRRIQMHGGNLRGLAGREVWPYLRQWLQSRREESEGALRTACHRKRRAPASWLQYPERIRDVALCSYRPGPYSGRVAFLRVTGSYPAEARWEIAPAWRGCLERGLELHEISGEHETVFSGKHLEGLARTMQQCLCAAQAAEGCA